MPSDAPTLRVAAAQFPVSGQVSENLGHVLALLDEAAMRGADVVHFPESALPGYRPRHDVGPPAALSDATATVQRRAHQHGLWVVIGTESTDEKLPASRTLVVSPDGNVAGTYDKRRLYQSETACYRPGRHPLVLDIAGVRCGFLICYENCFPELYAELRRQGVSVVFHSFYNAANRRPTAIRHLMEAMLLVRAADHGLHISASNSSEPYSPLPATLARPDGVSRSVERHVTGLVIDEVPSRDLGWTP
ncbi:MAG: carbon-nitrogen hydrolase family protein [Myxococcota bacterium]